MKIRNLLLTCTLALGVMTLATSCSGADDKIHVGILQYASHDALANAKEGFISKLEEIGYGKDDISFDVKNPEGDPSLLTSMASSFNTSRYDLVYAIATPAAIAVKNEFDSTDNKTPILFSAVTDAVSAGLVASNEAPGGTITGTNDMNPVEDQIQLLLDQDSTIKKIGIIYTSSENNSVIQSNIAKAYCETKGVDTVIRTISAVTDLQTVANSVVGSVDALYLPTDNVVASAMETIVQALVDNNVSIPVSCGEGGMVTAGGMLTYALDYTMLGEQTGVMADKIFKGTSPADIPVESQSTYDLVVNKDAAKKVGVTIKEEIIAKADVIIEEEN